MLKLRYSFFPTQLIWPLFTSILLISSASASDRNVEAAEIAGETTRSDGSEIHWMLSNATPDQTNRIVFVAHGSGCAPARLSASVQILADVLSSDTLNYAVLTIEKYDVTPDDAPVDPIEGCSDAFVANNTVSQRVADAMAVFDYLRAQGLFGGELILFGGSEGGAVVSILAHQTEDADAVIVLSTGTGLTMAEFFPMVAPPPASKAMQTVFDKVRIDPTAEGLVGGLSYAWWRDILDRRLSDDLLRTTIPVLLVHGVNDRSAPVEAARATRDAFAAAEQADRLAYWELPDRDHAMTDPQGVSHMEDVLRQIGGWIEKQHMP